MRFMPEEVKGAELAVHDINKHMALNVRECKNIRAAA